MSDNHAHQHPFAGSKGSKLRAHLLDVVGYRDGWRCRMCSKAHLFKGKADHNSAVLDHIRPHQLRADLTWNAENLQLVCKQCHDTTCQSIERRLWPDADAIALEKTTGPSAAVTEDGRPIW